MSVFLNSFLSTLGVLAACGVCAALFAIADLIYNMMKNGIGIWVLPEISDLTHPPEWRYEPKDRPE